MHGRTLLGAAIGAATLATATLVAVPSASAKPPAPPTLGVVATGFAGPLHVAFGPHDSLYVADAFAGLVARVNLHSGGSTVVASGLGFSPGIDVRGHGSVLVARSDAGGPGPQTPTSLVRISRTGAVSQVADLLAYELTHNPDGQDQAAQDSQSNPYSVLVADGRTFVADAGANDILEVRKNGSVRTVVALPNTLTGPCATVQNNDSAHPGCDPVPTDLEMGDDGYLYVSGLGSEVVGSIYKINPRTGTIVRTWTGFPPLTGIAVHDGTIYAASLFTNTVFRIRRGTTTTATVPAPTDVEWGDGMLVAASLSGNIFSVPRGLFS